MPLAIIDQDETGTELIHPDIDDGMTGGEGLLNGGSFEIQGSLSYAYDISSWLF